MDEPTEPGPLERMAMRVGKSPSEVASLDRFFAGLREYAVARFNLEVSLESTTRSLRNFAEALRASEERLTKAEAEEIAATPDLMELDAQLNGFYARPA